MRTLSKLICAIATLLVAGPSLAAEPAGTLERIAETGKFTIGIRSTSPPMSFVDGSGVPSGYSVDLCKAIGTETARHLKRDLSVEFVPVTAADRFDRIVDGSIDILCGVTTKTLGRAAIVDFTQHTFVTGAGLLSPADAKAQTLAQLQGKKIAVVSDTTTIGVLRDALKNAYVEAEIVPVADAIEGVKAMLDGKVAAFSADQIVLIGFIRSIPDGGRKLYLAPELLSQEPFALALARNDADFRLVADRALSRLYRSGRIVTIYEKWFPGLKPPPLLRALYQLNATPE